MADELLDALPLFLVEIGDRLAGLVIELRE
jgi:hypothetical protein